jgi:quinol monooxygenase YgiN
VAGVRSLARTGLHAHVVRQPVRAKYADDFAALVDEFTKATCDEPGNITFGWCPSGRP